MKVLYDYQILRVQRYGGISRYFYELISEFNINHMCSTDIRCLFSENEYFKNRLNNVLHEDIQLPLEKGILNRIYYSFLLRTLDYDIFHPTYYHPYFWGKSKGKVVITVYDMIHELYSEYFDETRTVSYKKTAIYNADHIIAISESTKKDILKLYPNIEPNKITVIYLSSRFNRDVDCNKYREKFPSKYILFVGTRKLYKNFENFFRGIESLLIDDNNLALVCMGGGTFDENENMLIGKVKDRVFQMDTDDDILKCAYTYAECFVFPSLYEGFGIPTLEAFACECPVVLSNTSSMPEVGGDAAIYFDPSDICDMREKIKSVLYDKNKRNIMIENGKKQLKKFNWHSIAEQTLECYKKVLESEKV